MKEGKKRKRMSYSNYYNSDSDSDGETETGVEDEDQPLAVSSYHLEDEDDVPVCFSVLPLKWSESGENKDENSGKVFLRGFADNGLRKIFIQVTAWRFDLSSVKLGVSVLSKEGNWVVLQKPRKSFLDTVRTVLVTLCFLHRVKKNPKMSAESVWNYLCKDKELSSLGFKPSEDDLLEHMSLIGEAAKRDVALAKSKLLATILKKPKNQKLTDKEVKDLSQPGLIVDGIVDDMVDKVNEESEAEDVCALCDNGGVLVCCEGSCMRSFHGTKEDGRDTACDSLGLTQKEVDETKNFYCKNCEYHQHQCFACGKLGTSDKVKGAEVIKCASRTCGQFYHPHCVAKLLPGVVEHVAEELETDIANGNPFTCPIHYCCVCKKLEDKMDPELQFAVCRRCPKSYHRKCLPREIAFDGKHDKGMVTRAWEGLLPNNCILIYCLNHEIDDALGTPPRDHIKFPKIKSTNGKVKPANQQRAILKKNKVDSSSSSGKSTAKGSKVTGKLSSGEVGGRNSENSVSVSNISRKPKSNGTSRCLSKNKRSITKKSKMPYGEENSNKVDNEGSDQIKHDNQVDNMVNDAMLLMPISALPPLEADSERRPNSDVNLGGKPLEDSRALGDQASDDEGQEGSLHLGNVDREEQEGPDYRVGKSGKKAPKRKCAQENDRSEPGTVSPAKGQAVNKQEHRAGKSGKKSKKRKRVLDNDKRELVSRAKRQTVDEVSEGVPDDSEPNSIQPRSDSTETNSHNPPCGKTESSYSMNTPAKEQEAPRLDEPNHVKMSSLHSEPPTFGRSGSFERNVAQPQYSKDGLGGFARCINHEYSRRHSAGWIVE